MEAPTASIASYDSQQKVVEDRSSSQHALLDEHMRSKSTASNISLVQSIIGGSADVPGAAFGGDVESSDDGALVSKGFAVGTPLLACENLVGERVGSFSCAVDGLGGSGAGEKVALPLRLASASHSVVGS